MRKEQTKLCKHCKTEISKDAKVCPQCRKKQGLGIVPTVIIVFFALALLGTCMDSNEPSNNDTNTNETTNQTDTNTQISDSNVLNSNTSQESEPNLTLGQKNALSTAKNYLDFTSFSYEGLIEQLEFEGYTTEEATYAVDNCGADWNEQALKSAKNYLNTMSFSYTGLIKQLEYEKFTTEQATYGVDNCAADWNEQAAKTAQNYLDTMSFSREQLIEQLEYEGFTSEQAEYGVTQVGY